MKNILMILLVVVAIVSLASGTVWKWVDFNESQPKIPDDAVYSGYDKNGKKHYIIRKAEGDHVYYGDVGDGADKKDGFVVKPAGEVEVADFELLIAEKHVWCPHDSTKSYELPVCRAKHLQSLCSGTLHGDGSCQLVFPTVELKTENVEVLIVGQSEC